MRLRLPSHLFAEPPYVVYLRCRNHRSRPKGLRGEWIESGRLYTGRYFARETSGKHFVRLDGRHAEPPHQTLPAWRFIEVAEVWLN